MFLDTSIIIELLAENGESPTVQRILSRIGGEDSYISIIQLGELSDWCFKNGHDPDFVINNITAIVDVYPLDAKIVALGSRIKWNKRSAGNRKFSLIDGIILASAMEINEKLLTLDSDFRDLENVIMISE